MPDTPQSVLGNNLRRRRERRGLKQRQLARQLGIQQATLNKIEGGERVPTLAQAIAISTFLEGELSELHLMMPARYPAPALDEEAA